MQLYLISDDVARSISLGLKEESFPDLRTPESCAWGEVKRPNGYPRT